MNLHNLPCCSLKGEKVSEEDVDKVIETGEAENLFQTAFKEQVRCNTVEGERERRNPRLGDKGRYEFSGSVSVPSPVVKY
jgi:hypothetical protein